MINSLILDEDEKNITVEATTINEISIQYKCPFCWRLQNGRILDSPFNKKNKRLYASAKHNFHYHGSGGDLSNRKEHRLSHCLVNSKKGVFIEITDNTKRYY